MKYPNFINMKFSLHHTKPLGIGENGVLICDKIYEQSIRNVINFGYDMVKLGNEITRIFLLTKKFRSNMETRRIKL